MRSHIARVILVSAGLWTQGAIADSESALVQIEGPPVQGSLVEILPSGTVVLQSEAGPIRFETKQIIRWGDFIEPVEAPALVCAGGSLIRCELEDLRADGVRWRSPVFPSTDLDRRLVLGVVLQWIPDQLGRDRLVHTIQSRNGTTDRIWMQNGDEIDGHVATVQPNEDQTTANQDQLQIRLSTGGTSVQVRLANVNAVALSSAGNTDRSRKPKLGLLGLRDGSRLLVDRISENGTEIELELNDATIVKTAAETLWRAVCAFLPLSEQVVYVSDLSSLDYRHIPYLTTTWSLGVDRSTPGGLLRQAGRIYPKGLGMHSSSRCAFSLDGKFRRFESELAINEHAGRSGSVIFRVYAESRTATNDHAAWQLVYESPTVRRGDRPLPMSVNIAAATRLALVVDLADRGDLGDHANWLNARLIP